MMRIIDVEGRLKFIEPVRWPYEEGSLIEMIEVYLPDHKTIKNLEKEKFLEWLKAKIPMRIIAITLETENVFPLLLYYKELGIIHTGSLSKPELNGVVMGYEQKTQIYSRKGRFPYIPSEYDRYIYICKSIPGKVMDGILNGSIEENNLITVRLPAHHFVDEMKMFEYAITPEIFTHGQVIDIQGSRFSNDEIKKSESKELFKTMLSRFDKEDFKNLYAKDYDKIISKYFN